VIVAAGPDVKAFEQPPLLIDLAPTILAALDAPASIEHTGDSRAGGLGRSGGEEADDPPRSGSPDSWHGWRPGGVDVTDIQADEMEEHLRGLGYLE
jgi:hypothetical protein